MNRLKSPVEAEDQRTSISDCRSALASMERSRDPNEWFRLSFELAELLQYSSDGDVSAQQEEAIALYQSLRRHIGERQPTTRDARERRTNVLRSLGDAYRDRIHGEKKKNLQKATRYYNKALESLNRREDRENYAQVHISYANLYRDYSSQIGGDLSDNIERGITHCRRTLEVCVEGNLLWAYTQSRLADLCMKRPNGNRARNLLLAIKYYNNSANLVTYRTRPRVWGGTHIKLGEIYEQLMKSQARGARRRKAFIESAIFHYQTALQVYRRETTPKVWADIQVRLMFLNWKALSRTQVRDVRRSIGHARLALRVFSQKDYPEMWGMLHRCLGDHHCFILGSPTFEQSSITRDKSLERAIPYYRKALEVFTLETEPEMWAWVHCGLGTAYWRRSKGYRLRNLKSSIEHFQRALKVFTPEYYSPHYGYMHSKIADRLSLTRQELEETLSTAFHKFLPPMPIPETRVQSL